MSQEKLNTSPEQYKQNPEALREAAESAHERLKEDIERKAETAAESSPETARHEALEKAKSSEKERRQLEQEKSNPEKNNRTNVTKADRKASYNRTMTEIQSQMSPAGRTFSKIIHQPAVEKVSAAVGSTVARPNAMLSGAVFAFVLTLAVYLIGKHLGYPLSGFETIGAFVLGWVIGIIYDFLRVMITGKKA